MFGLFKRKPDPSQAARELGAHARRSQEQLRRDTTDAMRAAQGKPPYQWRPLR